MIMHLWFEISVDQGKEVVWSTYTIWTNQPNQLRDKLEYREFACSKFSHYSILKGNNKGTDKTAQPCSLISTFVVGMHEINSEFSCNEANMGKPMKKWS